MARRVWTVDGVDWISVRDAARTLGVHENTIRNWMETGRLDFWQLPGDRMFRRVGLKSVQRVLEAQDRASERVVVEWGDLDVGRLAEALRRAWARREPQMPPSAVNWRSLAANVIDEMAGFVTDVAEDGGAAGNVSDAAGRGGGQGAVGGEGRPGSPDYNPEGWV